MVHRPRSCSLVVLRAALPQAAIAWQPPMDMYRTQDGWAIKLELAGVRLQDMALTVQGTQLRVAGLRCDWNVEAGWRQHAMEIAYNRFERIITLP